MTGDNSIKDWPGRLVFEDTLSVRQKGKIMNDGQIRTF